MKEQCRAVCLNDDSIGIRNKSSERAGPALQAGEVQLGHNRAEKLIVPVQYRMGVVKPGQLGDFPDGILATRTTTEGLPEVVAVQIVGAHKAGSLVTVAGSDTITCGIDDIDDVNAKTGRNP